MRARYLALGPLGELAHAGDRAAAGRIVEAIAHDADWPVRARAAELAAGVPDAPAVARRGGARPGAARARGGARVARHDRNPSPDAVRAAVDALDHEGWSFVKAQAVGAARQRSRVARRRRRAGRGAARPVAARPRRGRRRAGAAARGRLACDDPRRASTTPTKTSRSAPRRRARSAPSATPTRPIGSPSSPARSAAPATDEDAQQLGFAALVGLAALQPPDLQSRLAPLLAPGAPPYARAAAQRALAARGMCSK